MPTLKPAFLVAALFAGPAFADEIADAQAVLQGGPVLVNVSYAVNETVLSVEPEALAAQDRLHRRALMARAEAECADFLATIASDCAVMSINISTQVNTYPGQPPALYVNSNVALQITLRSAAPQP